MRYLNGEFLRFYGQSTSPTTFFLKLPFLHFITIIISSSSSSSDVVKLIMKYCHYSVVLSTVPLITQQKCETFSLVKFCSESNHRAYKTTSNENCLETVSTEDTEPTEHCWNTLYVLSVLKEPNSLRRLNTTRRPLTTNSKQRRP